MTDYGKIYSIEADDSSPAIIRINLGQYIGGLGINDVITVTDNGIAFTVTDIFGIDNPIDDESYIVTDQTENNALIEREADEIIDFSESNPFGDF